MLLEGESINLHGTPLNRLSPANQSWSRHGPSHLSVQGTRRRLQSPWAEATISIRGNSSCRKGRGREENNVTLIKSFPPTDITTISNEFLVNEPKLYRKGEGEGS